MNNLFNDLIIFEMANSHQGSVEHGINIVKEMGKIARKYNINAAVKLQYRDIENFIHPAYKGRNDLPHIPRFMSTKLDYTQFSIIVDVIKKEGMIAMSTPFDEKGVEWCVNQGLDIIKVASCSATDWPLLEAIADTGKKIIISTGGKTIAEIDNIYNFFLHRNCDFAFMHCVAEYPAPMERLQLDFIELMRKRYRGVEIGYSGHEDPNDNIVPAIALAKGATIFERHVGLPTESIKLNAYSMNPNQAEKWVDAILRAKEICSLKKGKERYISQDELDSLNSLKRGVFMNCSKRCGEEITRKDVFFAMPLQEGQLTSGEFIDGIIVTKDYAEKDAVFEVRQLSRIGFIRTIIHDAKGLLYESGQVLGNQYEVELSHHYGIECFRSTGVVIVSIINREYCKKLLIVLPGQKHPEHCHRIKEETFQLLYGDLEVVIEGKTRQMKPGDTQTVLRNEMHAFSSKGGAVFEEISTTHIKNDSYYSDPIIAKKDLIERKTIIKEW